MNKCVTYKSETVTHNVDSNTQNDLSVACNEKTCIRSVVTCMNKSVTYQGKTTTRNVDPTNKAVTVFHSKATRRKRLYSITEKRKFKLSTRWYFNRLFNFLCKPDNYV